jgi:hypothetical protein
VHSLHLIRKSSVCVPNICCVLGRPRQSAGAQTAGESPVSSHANALQRVTPCGWRAVLRRPREEASGAFVATQLWHKHTKPHLYLAGVECAGRCHLTSRVYICCRLFLLGIGALNSVVTNQNAEFVQTKRFMHNDSSRSRHMPAHCVSSWQWHCTTAPFRCGQRPFFWTKAQYPAAKGRCFPPCTAPYN